MTCPASNGPRRTPSKNPGGWTLPWKHRHHIHSISPGAADTVYGRSDLISDTGVWLAGDASCLLTGTQIPAGKNYLTI